MWLVHTREYYSATKWDEILTHGRASENITLSERSQTQEDHVVKFHLCEKPRIGKSIDTKGRLVIARG